MIWNRPGGSPIDLQDTENLNAFAIAQGWTAEVKVKRKRRTKEEMANGSDSGTSNEGDTPGDTG